MNETHFKLIPGPEFSPRLYRGQIGFHDPCHASVFRPMDELEQISNAIKKEEFVLMIREHPVVMELEKTRIKNLLFYTDYEGLAQHYGFKTRYLDATTSLEIAMFFACCPYCLSKNAYKQISEDNQSGVLYTIDLRAGMASDKRRIDIVGLQALPRPGAQKAFSIVFETREDFNTSPYVTWEPVQITPKISNQYFEKFQNSKLIFPQDLVDYKAKEIIDSATLSKDAFILYSEKNEIKSGQRKRIQNKLVKNGFEFREQNVRFSLDEMRSILSKWRGKKSSFIDKIKARFEYPPAAPFLNQKPWINGLEKKDTNTSA